MLLHSEGVEFIKSSTRVIEVIKPKSSNFTNLHSLRPRKSLKSSNPSLIKHITYFIKHITYEVIKPIITYEGESC